MRLDFDWKTEQTSTIIPCVAGGDRYAQAVI